MPIVILARKTPDSPVSAQGSHLSTTEYLQQSGVPELPPRTAPFDPGYDSTTIEGHLDQSGSLMEILKISMACWIIADENVTRRKVAAAASHSVPTVTEKSLFQIASAQGLVEPYLDLCADFGVARVECAEGICDVDVRPSLISSLARERGLEVQFEIGGCCCAGGTIEQLLDQGERWLDAGAMQLAVQSGDIEQGTAFTGRDGQFDPAFADIVVRKFGLDLVTFAAPDLPAQFAFLRHFGRQVHLCDVRLEDLLRVETFRRGLHSAAFFSEQLHPDATDRSRDTRH